jgi:hypothetical protein
VLVLQGVGTGQMSSSVATQVDADNYVEVESVRPSVTANDVRDGEYTSLPFSDCPLLMENHWVLQDGVDQIQNAAATKVDADNYVEVETVQSSAATSTDVRTVMCRLP